MNQVDELEVSIRIVILCFIWFNSWNKSCSSDLVTAGSDLYRACEIVTSSCDLLENTVEVENWDLFTVSFCYLLLQKQPVRDAEQNSSEFVGKFPRNMSMMKSA